MSIRLESDGGGTRLVFEHSGSDLSQPWSDQAVQGAEFGWAKMLKRFQEVLAGLGSPTQIGAPLHLTAAAFRLARHPVSSAAAAGELHRSLDGLNESLR